MPDGYRDDNGFSWPEELQLEPDPPPRSPWWFRACLAGVVVIVGVLWWL